MGWFLVVLVGLLSLYNNVLNLLEHDLVYVPLNLGVALALVIASRRAGLSHHEMGLTREGVGPGLRWGGAIVLVIAAGLLVAYLVPFFRMFLGDERAAMSGAMVAFHALVRIPLGTVVLEEVAFRGVLLGAWRRVASLRTAIAGTCAVFGLWHIVPALELVRVNELAVGFWQEAGLVAIAVIATGASSVILVALRIWTKGIWGPCLVHAGANSLALTAAFSAQ